LSTRKVSANTAGLSVERLTTQLEMTTSTVPAGSGMASIWPLRKSTLVAPASAALARARASISSVMSSPYALPDGPTRLADNSASMPPPEPRSSTISPSSATAVGLPQPRLASSAASGSWSRSRPAYSSAPNPGSWAVAAAPQQLSPQPQSAGCPQPQSPLVTLVAAAA
jgi:hypothetical protein